MAHLIDKSALVAEIEKRIKEHHSGYLVCLKDILSFLETLEVKEVDLEKEIKDYFVNQPIITKSKGIDYKLIPSAEKIAKHFFELGMAVSNKALKG